MMTLDHETLKGVMERPPRKMSDRLLDRSLILKAFFWYGMLESLLAIIDFFVTYWTSQGHFNHLAASGSLNKEAHNHDPWCYHLCANGHGYDSQIRWSFHQASANLCQQIDHIRHPFRNWPLYSPCLYPILTKDF